MATNASIIAMRCAKKNYDRVVAYIPKGNLELVRDKVSDENITVNKLVNRMLRQYIGMTEEEWNRIAG